MKKRIIIAIIIIVLLVVVFSGSFLNKKENGKETYEVTRADVVQEVSETGQVEKGDKINLAFKNSGEIKKIYVKVGEEVNRGDILSSLNTNSLYIQLDEAGANLSIAQAKLDKLLAGATQEEINQAQTAVTNAEVSLANETAQAKADLADDYEDAQNILDDAYLKSYNAKNVADLIQRSYFGGSDQESINVKSNLDVIVSALAKIKSKVDLIAVSYSQDNIDTALASARAELAKISVSLKIIRETCEEPNYRSIVSSANKTSLDTQRTNINTALTSVVGTQQTIASTKLTNEESMNSATGVLQTAKDTLALLTATPRTEDVILYNAQVDSAKAQVNKLNNQIQDSILRAPTNAQVTEIKKKVGELAQQDTIISLMSLDPFEVKADIYEEDIVKVDVDDTVEITLVAFPNQIFSGRVISIDPAEKIINEVVYYEIAIAFNEMPEGLRPGMTADIIIKTELKENVLAILEDAILIKDDIKTVEVLKDGKIEERKIETGLTGSNDLVEIISGLKEGEKVILQ